MWGALKFQIEGAPRCVGYLERMDRDSTWEDAFFEFVTGIVDEPVVSCTR